MNKTMRPKQQQKLPGVEKEMIPQPIDEDQNYKGSNKLKSKVAIITGGDSGIGRAALIFGLQIVLAYVVALVFLINLVTTSV